MTSTILGIRFMHSALVTVISSLSRCELIVLLATSSTLGHQQYIFNKVSETEKHIKVMYWSTDDNVVTRGSIYPRSNVQYSLIQCSQWFVDQLQWIMKINHTFLKGVLYSSEELCDTGNLSRASIIRKHSNLPSWILPENISLIFQELYFLPARNASFMWLPSHESCSFIF